MILITGANGQLGQDFQRLFKKLNIPFVATSYTENQGVKKLDVTNFREIKLFTERYPFEIIINCAAYNDVDQAESDRDAAFKLNFEAPSYLAKIAKDNGSEFVTFSTDFVFDGGSRRPYVETDKPNPLNIYGLSKLEGEKSVLESHEKVFVIRTSWVFGNGRSGNFNLSVINWSKSKLELNVVDDQVSVPTYSKDLAHYSWKLIQSKKYGLYHLSNNGEASKYEQAKYVLKLLKWKGTLKRAKTSEFKLPANRAAYSKLNSTKAEKIIGMKMPHWKNAVERYLEDIREVGEL